jgi:hypothetical protein
MGRADLIAACLARGVQKVNSVVFIVTHAGNRPPEEIFTPSYLSPEALAKVVGGAWFFLEAAGCCYENGITR